MTKLPTSEEVKQKDKELENRFSNKIRNNLIYFLSIAVDQSSEGIAISDLEGNLEYINKSFAKKHGYTSDELIGKNLSIFHTSQQMPFVEKANRQTKKTGFFKGEIWHVRRDNSVFPALMHNSLIKNEKGDPIGMMGTLRDISDIKQAEKALQNSQKKLEDKVKQRTKELEIKNRQLEELNTALKVVLTKKNEDKINLEENILSNVKKLILPYLEKAKKNSVGEEQKTYLEIIESNLKEIISPFASKLSSKYINLTPAEIKVADLVKHGKRTKEIATFLNLSVRTIESHRDSIRKKIGIKNKKTNLRSYLLSLH